MTTSATISAVSDTITIRQAVFSDLDVLASLLDQYRQFYKRPSDVAAARAFLAERFDHGESVCFIAYDDAQPLGFTQLYPSFSSMSLVRIFVFNDLFVVDAGRRRGVGKGLIEAAADYARTLGARLLTLSTARDNEQAQALYRSTGWELEEDYVEYCLMLQK